ncbi:hypothetical protein EDD86DRAFT_278002 [Gorgonomyces haynaldii]|nr:hypothetical protein EDD86DRAFT_278002 [Gorgonomyces haynaldii]
MHLQDFEKFICPNVDQLTCSPLDQIKFFHTVSAIYWILKLRLATPSIAKFFKSHFQLSNAKVYLLRDCYPTLQKLRPSRAWPHCVRACRLAGQLSFQEWNLLLDEHPFDNGLETHVIEAFVQRKLLSVIQTPPQSHLTMDPDLTTGHDTTMDQNLTTRHNTTMDLMEQLVPEPLALGESIDWPSPISQVTDTRDMTKDYWISICNAIHELRRMGFRFQVLIDNEWREPESFQISQSQ